jgi:hypothetical protein
MPHQSRTTHINNNSCHNDVIGRHQCAVRCTLYLSQSEVLVDIIILANGMARLPFPSSIALAIASSCSFPEKQNIKDRMLGNMSLICLFPSIFD